MRVCHVWASWTYCYVYEGRDELEGQLDSFRTITRVWHPYCRPAFHHFKYDGIFQTLTIFFGKFWTGIPPATHSSWYSLSESLVRRVSREPYQFPSCPIYESLWCRSGGLPTFACLPVRWHPQGRVIQDRIPRFSWFYQSLALASIFRTGLLSHHDHLSPCPIVHGPTFIR